MLRRFFGSSSKSDLAETARVPDGRRIYAIGDIHGRADLLTEVYEMIRQDSEAAGDGKTVAIVHLGDYVDRGPQSREVIDMLLAPADGIESVCLKGNHEDLMLAFLDGEEIGRMWLYNGGNATLASYGVPMVDYAGDDMPAQARQALAAHLPPDHDEFLRGLKLMHLEGDYLFVHAGVRPGVDLARQDDGDLMWIRDEFLDATEDYGKIIVHGHSIRPEVELMPNRIGIDTGAFRSGRLTCLVLDGAARRLLQT